MITLLGHTFVFEGDASSKLPVHIFMAFCEFLYQTMDAADGKHARRTGQSTPLGALFDHGCDGVVTWINVVVVELVTMCDPGEIPQGGLPPSCGLQLACGL